MTPAQMAQGLTFVFRERGGGFSILSRYSREIAFVQQRNDWNRGKSQHLGVVAAAQSRETQVFFLSFSSSYKVTLFNVLVASRIQ